MVVLKGQGETLGRPHDVYRLISLAWVTLHLGPDVPYEGVLMFRHQE